MCINIVYLDVANISLMLTTDKKQNFIDDIVV